MVYLIKFNSKTDSSQTHSEPQLRLFCLPYAGARASVFYQWSKNLPSTVEVRGVELPGRGRVKYPPYRKMELLVRAIAEHILPLLDRPFAIFGHSMGGLVGFELARLLRSEYALEYKTLLHLFISARNAPQNHSRDEGIYHLPDGEFLEKIAKYNGTPDEILKNPEMRELFLPILRADFEVLDTYIYKVEPPFDFPITVFGGSEDPMVNHDDLVGWKEHTNREFSCYTLPGNHFFIRSHQELLLQYISQKLSKN
ncbi:thioesterase II family protein [Cylindrospermopsis curvispora]|uniref:Thioesterase n=1 Tax=Cylindrospermopsis curvispora GIHE-G1 TaxID=2666332 RepID=A0A7H0EWQ2_9CYAN|nr:alpha/beta fold hydrolase [Cylindrospermopsis curvispora]QNP28218.1 thioesterase [Cylindrospermopsis curvispora GIHE-G1]BAZ88621.1 thioesterase [Raphidiopsis curvata NIES-932]